MSGKDGFKLNLSTFNYFGVESLVNDTYTADFTASVQGYARLLRIKRLDYRKAVSDKRNFNH